MPDMSAIAAAVSALNGAKDIAQAMISLRDSAAFQTKLIEFQSKLIEANGAALTAQDERSMLLERIRHLEKEVTRLEAWEAEKQRYELKDVGLGTLAYVIKEGVRGAEPPHQICAACYQHGKKSLLQPRDISVDKLLICPECKTQIKIGDLHWGGPLVV